jgi:hypothetical protein
MLPLFSGLKWAGSDDGLVTKAGYNDGALKTGSTFLTITAMTISKPTCIIYVSTNRNIRTQHKKVR